MDKASRALIAETRTILDLLYSMAEGSENWDDDIPREEMTSLLYLARMRLDALNHLSRDAD